ncbi:light-harvesting Chl a protein 4 [Guillardia theta CCMP2712]|uniref:Light-harvesting Chl a protein 4 n=2 Tax=Guillardia theta TaxID=55529 RepID=L1IEY0_GUITC|nr:light-harvesting Chl a protein 4 [Guillardia theta CCMP2712]EKX34768.1 light-harvesting Chl a protein 4 [Guillardia theta CCMP2712]|eukprot:XP_005821748.1 light-harvesting Chl a protein 4 [Guillardia theta CCMP2712]
MLRTLLLVASAASAAAFAPSFGTSAVSSRSNAITGMKMQSVLSNRAGKSKAMPFLSQPEKLDGSMPGDVGFDPLGISTYFDLKWMREAELKHGRICMLAWTGCLVQEVIHLPGEAFSKKLALDAWASAPRGGMISILVAIGLIEMISNRFQLTATDMFANPARVPGDLGFDPLSLGNNPATRAKYELSEVIHGRAAMMGFSGVIHQMIVTKQPIIYSLLHWKSVDSSAFKLGGAAAKLGY